MSHAISVARRVCPRLLLPVLVATLIAVGFPIGLTPVRAQFGIDVNYLVIDPGAGTGAHGALFSVDPSTGNRTIVSDFGNAAEGPTGTFPVGVQAGGNAGTVVVIDRDAGTGGLGALFLVVLPQGNSPSSRTLLSDFGNPAQGPLGVNPAGVSGDSSGYLVVDPDAGTNGKGGLFVVDATTGARTLLSDFGNAGQGPLGDSPTGVEGSVAAMVVIDPGAGTGGQGALFGVDPTTGERTLLSDFGNASQGPTGSSPTGVSADTDTIFVVDPDAGTGSQGQMFLVDVATGARTILSDFGNAGQGPTGNSPVGVWSNTVIDSQAGTGGHGAVFVVDSLTGDRVIMTDFGNPSQGPLGVKPNGATVTLTVTCPLTLALKGAPEQGAALGLLYDIRDKVLAKTPAGQRYTKLFYAHAAEAVWLMVRHPELRSRTRALVERFAPTLRTIHAGRKVLLTPADLAAIDGLAQAFAEKAGARLRADLRAVQLDLRQGTALRELGIGLVPLR